MSTTVYAYQSDIIHLTDDAEAFPGIRPFTVKTRCGRQIAHVGTFGVMGAVDGSMSHCPRCGTEADFDAANADLNARQAAYEENRQREMEACAAEQRRERNLRREDVEALAAAMQAAGAECEVRPNWRGANVVIRYNGYSYELTCK
jgi:hypothetical protein